MTTELEQKFYDTFWIEPEYTYIGHYPLTDENGIIQPPTYPEITAEKLLQLLCIVINEYNRGIKMKNILGLLLLPTLIILIPLAMISGGIYYYVKYRRNK